LLQQENSGEQELIEFKSTEPFSKEDLAKYLCPVWQRLNFEAMKDIDNQVIRREILAHPFGCNHHVCKELARIFKEIIK
jgi:hypothetical protein